MSIETEISRLQTAKDNLKQSIINKGGIVFDDATLDEFSGYVDNLLCALDCFITIPQKKYLELTELIKTIPADIDFYGLEDISNLFSECVNLEKIPSIDTSTVKAMQYLFYNCSSLVTIDAIDLSSITPQSGYENPTSMMFKGCSNLKNITFYGSIPYNLDLSDCILLTHDSLMSAINALATVSGYTLKVGTNNLNKLTQAEKEIATNKGWILE